MRSNTFIVLFLVVFAAVKSQEEEENCVGDNQPCTPDTTCCSSNCFDGICSREEEPLIEDGAVQLESQHKKRAPTSRTMCTSTTITTPTTKPTPTSTTITTPTTKPTPTSTTMSTPTTKPTPTSTTITTPTTKPTPTSTTMSTPTTKPTPTSTTKSTLPCVLDGQSCGTNDDCCTENCVNQICKAPTTPCKIPGQICKFNSQCCSFSCTSTIERPFGKCLTCIHLTESCSSDKTCCSHYCNPSTSVCETLPAQSSEDE